MSNPITNCTIADFHQILQDFDQFWDREAVRAIHHPMFVREFGDTAFVIKLNAELIAYLFGFFSQTSPTAYVHLIGVHQSHRRQGLAAQLIEHFATLAQEHGCTQMKAITTPRNTVSIAFHPRVGFRLEGDPTLSGVQVVKRYSGLGQDRGVMLRGFNCNPKEPNHSLYPKLTSSIFLQNSHHSF